MRTDARWMAVDWGTTNRRAFALDGNAIERAFDDKGVLAIDMGGFPTAMAELRARLGDVPAVLAGMVGSTRGWLDAPYVACPVRLEDLAEQARAVPEARAWIVPGARDAQRDIMRGEEVQLLGAVAAGLAPADGLFCHPGTHAKWAQIERGVLTHFRTAMTGELFSLLRQHSILAPQLGARVAAGEAFLAGVDRALQDQGLARALFAVRARAVLDAEPAERASAFTSGLLIGDDVRIGMRDVAADQSVTLVGDPKLTALYAAAIRQARGAYVEVDGEAAFLGGIRAIAEGIS